MYGKIFKALRQINDMSLKNFSSWIGCSTGYLAQIEKGEQKPSDGFILIALESLKLSEEFFYNLMVYSELVEEDLKRNSNLTDENRALFLMQEIKYVILREQHKNNVQAGFIKSRKILM